MQVGGDAQVAMIGKRPGPLPHRRSKTSARRTRAVGVNASRRSAAAGRPDVPRLRRTTPLLWGHDHGHLPMTQTTRTLLLDPDGNESRAVASTCSPRPGARSSHREVPLRPALRYDGFQHRWTGCTGCFGCAQHDTLAADCAPILTPILAFPHQGGAGIEQFACGVPPSRGKAPQTAERCFDGPLQPPLGMTGWNVRDSTAFRLGGRVTRIVLWPAPSASSTWR